MLVGLPGSGKSAVGRRLAQRHGATADIVEDATLDMNYPTIAAVGRGSSRGPRVATMRWSGSAAHAAALAGNHRADLVGEHTIGRAASQKLIKLPDGSGLWLSTTRYLTPAGAPLHEKGLEPTVPVDDPDVEFGQPPPTTDPILDKAIERLSEKKAA